MVMRQETSLAAATARHLAYDLAKADLRDQYGPVLWRWKAPRRTRILLRRGEITGGAGLALTLTGTTDGTGHETTNETAALPAGTTPETAAGTGLGNSNGTGPETSPSPRRGGRETTGSRNGNRRRSWAECLPVAETVIAQMIAEGLELTRRPFQQRMETAGCPVGTTRAGELLAWYRNKTNPSPPPRATARTRPPSQRPDGVGPGRPPRSHTKTSDNPTSSARRNGDHRS
jgi:hypothetical protein